MEKIRDEMSCPEYLTGQERFILDWTGMLLALIGGAGLIFTIFFDQIARKESVSTYGWIQVSGILCSLALVLFGCCVEKYMKEIKVILEDYVRK